MPLPENMTRSLWDRVCLFEPVDYPPPYTIGGQCAGVLYEARLRDGGGTVRNWLSSTGGGAIAGPIEIIRARKFDAFQLGFPNTLELRYKNSAGAERGRNFGAPSISQAVDISSWDYEFFRTDNQPDACGIAPIPRPILPPTAPPTSFPININLPDVGNIPVTVNLPDLNVQAWPQFTFAPRINIEGVEFNFTPEGVNIDLPPNTPILPRPSGGASIGDIQIELDNQTNNISNNVSNIVNNNNQDISNIVNNNIEQVVNSNLRPLLCCMSDNILKLFSRPEFGLISNAFINQSGGVYPLPMRCIGVIIRAVEPIPNGVKGQAGSGDAPDVLFLGWLAFSRQGVEGGDRQPWNFAEQYNPVPSDCNIVVVSSNYGCRFNISFVVSEPIETTNCCAGE